MTTATRRREAVTAQGRIPPEGRQRAVIENVTPCVDGGRFPAKRVVGDKVVVEADLFGDGHDLVAAALRYRHEHEEAWHETPMTPL